MCIVTENQKLWDSFSESLSEYKKSVKERIDSGEIKKMHQMLSDITWHPYTSLHSLSDNIGAATGLFFEFNAQVFILPFLEKKVGCSLDISINSCPGHKKRGLPRDPDIYLKANGREVVIELKVSPKKRDINHVRKLKQRYSEQSIPYYFLGNQLSLNKQGFEEASELGWMSFLHASKKNVKYLDKFPTYDDIIERISKYLNCSS